MEKISGVGPDAPVVTNSQGARQSKCDYLFIDFCPQALLAIRETGAKYRPMST